MTDERLTIYICSGFHVTDSTPRVEGVSQSLDEVDTVFSESVLGERPSKRTILLNAVAALPVVVGLHTYLFALEKLNQYTGNSDQQIVEIISSKYNADIIETDLKFHSIIAEDRVLWGIAHVVLYLIVAISAFLLLIVGFSQVYIAVLSIVLIVLASMAFFLPATMKSRNLQMIRDMENHALDSKSKSAVLVVGGAHDKGLEKEIEVSHYLQLTE